MTARKNVAGINMLDGNLTITGLTTAPVANYVLTSIDSLGTCDWKNIATLTAGFVSDSAGYHTPSGIIGIGTNSVGGTALSIGGTLSSGSLAPAYGIAINNTHTPGNGATTTGLSIGGTVTYGTSTAVTVVGLQIATWTGTASAGATAAALYGIKINGYNTLTNLAVTDAWSLFVSPPGIGTNKATSMFAGTGNGFGTISNNRPTADVHIGGTATGVNPLLINAQSGQTADLVVAQVNGTTEFSVGSGGTIGQGSGAFSYIGFYQAGTLTGSGTVYGRAINTVLKPNASGGNVYFDLVANGSVDTSGYASGAVTGAYGTYITAYGKSAGTNNVTNAWGLYANRPSAGTANWGAFLGAPSYAGASTPSTNAVFTSGDPSFPIGVYVPTAWTGAASGGYYAYLTGHSLTVPASTAVTQICGLYIQQASVSIGSGGSLANGYGILSYAPTAGTTLYAGYFVGNGVFTGALSKGSGTFLIDHPHDPLNYDLAHGFVEAPRYDLVYRGRATLKNGKATVSIDAASTMRDGTFSSLTRESEADVTLQNRTGFARCIASDIQGGKFTITCEDKTSSDEITWVVIAERNDAFVKSHLDPNTDSTGRFIPERLKPAPDDPNVPQDRRRGWYRHPEAWGKPSHPEHPTVAAQ